MCEILGVQMFENHRANAQDFSRNGSGAANDITAIHRNTAHRRVGAVTSSFEAWQPATYEYGTSMAAGRSAYSVPQCVQATAGQKNSPP